MTAPIITNRRLRIDFCCNDPDSGNFVGRVCQISVEDGILDLTARQWNMLSFRGCPTLRKYNGAIALSGKRWPVLGSKAWVGNWCWDGYWMSDPIARRFLVWLHSRQLFDCEGGLAALADAWERAEPLPLEPGSAVPSGPGRLLCIGEPAEAPQ